MSIWLSWFAAHRIRQYRLIEAQEGRECIRDDSDIFRRLVAKGRQTWNIPAIQSEPSDRSGIAWFDDLVTPLIADDAGDVPPLALRIDQAPIFDCPAEYSDDDIVTEGQKILSQHSVVYLDLADRIFMMPGGIFQIRSLFCRQEEPFNRFCAVITRPGTNKGGRLVWSEGRYERNAKNGDYDEVWVIPSKDIHDPEKPIRFRKIDYSGLADAESLFWLALVCWQHLINNTPPPMPAEPLTSDRTEVLPLCWWDDDLVVRDELSLFRIVRMPAIDEDRIRVARQSLPRQSHKKCRHNVAGFYRWQPYGKSRKERRRIWVAGHQRGSGPAKASLHVLPVGPSPIRQ